MMRCVWGAVIFTTVVGCVGPMDVETGPDAPLLFLAQRAQPTAVMQALFQGRVEVDQAGCFRLANSEGATVIWPFGSTLVRDDVSLIILDRSGNESVRVGHRAKLGGGEVNELTTDIVESTMLEAARRRCPGSYWIVGEVQTVEE